VTTSANVLSVSESGTPEPSSVQRDRKAGWWTRWSRLPGKAKAGLIILGVFVLLAIIGPYLAPYDPSATNSAPDLQLAGPSASHLLGTTQSGQDVLSQLLTGIRQTMILGLAVGAIATALSAVIGVAAGYFGGIRDELLSLVSNVFLVLPVLPLLVILLGYQQAKGALVTIIVLSVFGWPWGARVIRAQTLTLANRDYVIASRKLGESAWRIIVVEIVPNMTGLIVASFINTVLYAIGTSVALAFLGLADLQNWSLGTMLYWAQSQTALPEGAWWWFLPPGLVVALIGTALVLLNFGLDEFSNPRHRTDSATQKLGKRLQRVTDPTPVLEPSASSADTAAEAPVVTLAVQENAGPVDAPTELAKELSGTARPVLELDNFSVAYRSHSGLLHAVKDVNLALAPGEIVGLAGESGSGKSTLAYGATRLLPAPGVVTGGSAIYRGRRVGPDGVEITRQTPQQLRALRWREIAIVFQSAMSALNPILRVQDQLVDAMKAHLEMSGDEMRERSGRLFEMVGIPRSRLRSYPHELSGGMRQRVMIAMALATDPEIIIMDEPTTALDVVVQREILSEIMQLKQELGFAVLFITHDLSLLLELADRIAVMYSGRLVEVGPSAAIRDRPDHPYTQGLLNSFPALRGPKRDIAGIPGSPPDLRHSIAGCAFAPRCPHAAEACRTVDMELLEVRRGADAARRRTACPFITWDDQGARRTHPEVAS
jgi:peptide/nickel transport system ATP-binding protein/peptide/nickel transport system permease protein